MLIHDNSKYVNSSDKAIDILFCVFLYLFFLALCFCFAVTGWLFLLLDRHIYAKCSMSKYRSLTRLGFTVLPIPIVKLIPIGICVLIGKLKYDPQSYTLYDDGFDRKQEGLIFKIYAKLMFIGRGEFKASIRYTYAYAKLHRYYISNGFHEILMKDRCVEAVDDGMSIIEAAKILQQIVGYDKNFAIDFVNSLLQIPCWKNSYNGAEKNIREIADIFRLTKEEYYTLICVNFKALSKSDKEFRSRQEQFFMELAEIWEVQNRAKAKESYSSYGNYSSYNNSEEQANSSNESSSYSNFDSELDEYYKVLGCNKNSSIEEIKAAYKTLIKQTHPDKLPKEVPEWMKQMAAERFSTIQDAYEKIMQAKKST